MLKRVLIWMDVGLEEQKFLTCVSRIGWEIQKGFPMMYVCLMCPERQMRNARYGKVPSVVDSKDPAILEISSAVVLVHPNTLKRGIRC